MPDMWWFPPLPSVPSSEVFADDISVEQLEADLRLIDSIRMVDLEEMFDLENRAFEKKTERTHRRMKKRHLVNTENRISSVAREIDALMTTGLPVNMQTEFLMLLQMINRLFQKKLEKETVEDADLDRYFLFSAYSIFDTYLQTIVESGFSNEGAYYFLNIKIKSLIRIAEKHGVDFEAGIKKNMVMRRSKADQDALNRNPDHLCNAYIEQHFPVLARRQIYASDKIVYAFLQEEHHNIHMLSITELLEKKHGDVDTSQLSFYHFQGYNSRFPDEELDRLLNMAAGSQFNEFKASYLQASLEPALAAMAHTPMGFQRESVLPERIRHANSDIDLFSPIPQELTRRNSILLFGASMSIADLLERNPDFQGMDLNTLLMTDFIVQYTDGNGIERIETAKLPDIFINNIGRAGKTLPTDVHVRWPRFFNQRQREILSEEMQKLHQVALKLGLDLPKINAQTKFWLAMPPLTVMLDQILEKICNKNGVPRLQLEDKFSFLYDDKRLFPFAEDSLDLMTPVWVQYSVGEMLLGKKRLYERDEWFLAEKKIRAPVHFKISAQKLLHVVDVITSIDVQDILTTTYRNYLNDEAVFKAFSELRSIVEPPEKRKAWSVWEIKDNPNILFYIKGAQMKTGSIFNIEGRRLRKKHLKQGIGDREVMILFRLSGNRYHYKNESELKAALRNDVNLKADVAAYMDVETGLHIEKIEWKSAWYEHKPGQVQFTYVVESDEALFKRIVEWGALNIDKRVTSALEAYWHEFLDGFSIGGYVAFIPALFFSWPVGLCLGLLYGVAPKLLQASIAVREDEIAQLQYDAFKNLLMEAAGSAAGAAAEKAGVKLLETGVKIYKKSTGVVNVVKDVVQSATHNSQSVMRSLRGRMCEKVALAVCAAVMDDDMLFVIQHKRVAETAIAATRTGSGKESGKIISDKLADAASKLSALIFEAVKYPLVDRFDALLPTEEYLEGLGFSSFTYRAVGIWPIDSNAPHHIIVFATLDGKRYVIDFKKYLQESTTSVPNGSIVTDATQWSWSDMSSPSSTTIVYKDFEKRQGAINCLNTLFHPS